MMASPKKTGSSTQTSAGSSWNYNQGISDYYLDTLHYLANGPLLEMGCVKARHVHVHVCM